MALMTFSVNLGSNRGVVILDHQYIVSVLVSERREIEGMGLKLSCERRYCGGPAIFVHQYRHFKNFLETVGLILVSYSNLRSVDRLVQLTSPGGCRR